MKLTKSNIDRIKFLKHRVLKDNNNGIWFVSHLTTDREYPFRCSSLLVDDSTDIYTLELKFYTQSWFIAKVDNSRDLYKLVPLNELTPELLARYHKFLKQSPVIEIK